MMKKRTILRTAAPVLIVLVIGGIAMFGPLKDRVGAWMTMHRKVQLGTLVSCSYSSSGDMRGNWYVAELRRTDDGLTLTIEDRDWYDALMKVSVYRADDDALTQMDEIIRRYSLSLWPDLPLTDLFALDGPSVSYGFAYDNSAVGGSKYGHDYYSISDLVQVPAGGEDALKSFLDCLFQWVSEERLLSVRFEDRDGNVVDPQALTAPDGSWTCPYCDHAGNLTGYCDECGRPKAW